jgi:hypothetical protein
MARVNQLPKWNTRNLAIVGLVAGAASVLTFVMCGCGDEAGDDTDSSTSDVGSEGVQDGDDNPEETPDSEPGAEATKGAVSVYFPATSGCSVADQSIDFPDVPTAPPVTATDHSALVEHGDSAVVSCRFLSAESPVHAALGITVASNGGSSFVSLAPELEVGVAHEHGFRIQGPGDLPALRPPEGVLCNFTAIELDVEEGFLWGSFTCPLLTDDGGIESCSDVKGYFYFENCVD